MNAEKRSITHCKTNSKPEIIAPSPMLYSDEEGAHLFWDVLGERVPEGMTIIAPKLPDESNRYHIRYAFIGGKNHHSVEVQVEDRLQTEHDIQWIYVRSFTGGQIRFLKSSKDAYALFAMSEDDAYMFCQNDPCIECAFACKVGFEIFAWSISEGLLKDSAKVVYSR